uniref:Uncharacterized protein n=1 Tax=viral metagenome TaxID=1070528 RepID=A0A6C0E9M3_9ZZZZ
MGDVEFYYDVTNEESNNNIIGENRKKYNKSIQKNEKENDK